MKSEKAMKPLVLKFSQDLINEIDAVRVVKERLVSRSEFIREAVRCLTRLPAERLWWLHQHAQNEEVRLPRLIREAVELLVIQKGGETVEQSRTSRPKASR